MTVGERIRSRRRVLGVSADDLAETAGVSRATITRYENGSTVKIPDKILVRVSRALYTTVDCLLGLEDDIVGSDDEDALEAIRVYVSLPPKERAEALNYLHYLAERGDKTDKRASRGKTTG